MFDSILKSIPHHMDFDGQRRAERYFQTIIVLFAVSGLIWGYVVQQFSMTVYTLGAGFLLAALLTLPPWPIYRRKPLQWQKPKSDDSTHKETVPKSKKKK
jgi:signal peptidase complex subunit 1